MKWHERVLNWWRYKSILVDFFIILGLALAGFMAWPKILIALGAGLLAASPVWKYITMAREHPRVDARKMVREISVEVVGYAIIATCLAYLLGAGLAWLFW